MATVEDRTGHSTHEVTNQASPLENVNLFEADRVLSEALKREGADWAEHALHEVGAFAGSALAQRWGREANENPPKLRTHDRFGHRIDEVEFHPAWHELMKAGVGFGLHSLPWREPQAGAHTARAAMFMVFGQAEAGVGCPISMTYSGVPALRTQPELAAEWEPRLTSNSYDGERLRPAPDKAGALCGMAMTEKQGGSDVRANTTTARAINGGGPRRRVRADRPQVVHVGADVRRLPGPRPGARRPLVLPDAPLHAGRRAQPRPPPAPQGQARQPLQRLVRGGVPRRLGADDRRGGARRPDDHRDGQPHPARLRDRRRRSDAGRHRAGDPPLLAALDVRQGPDRAAADAERPGRSRDRVRGGDASR